MLKRRVMLELSADADVMLVLLGLVQRKDAAGDCAVVAVPTKAV